MKLSTSFVFQWAVLAAFSAVFPLSAQAQTEANGVFVTAVGGTATYAKGGVGSTPVITGVQLRKGDVITTGPSSHVDLEVGNGVGVIQMTADSKFAIGDITVTRTTADTVTDSQFDLRKGAIYAKVHKLSKASRYEIKTPKGIAGIRATTVYLDADGNMTVGEGTAGISYFGGGTFVLREGQSMTLASPAPLPASGQALKELMDAIWDAVHHGIGRDLPTFIAPVEVFISPILPHKEQRAE